jgi:uncharacterized membrane protein
MADSGMKDEIEPAPPDAVSMDAADKMDPDEFPDSDDMLDSDDDDSMHVGETPTRGERRTRRSVMHTSAFRAIKARQSGNHTRMQVFSTSLTELAASTGFFVFHVIAFTAWIVVNLGLFGLPQFDPFPFGLLTMIVSLEAIFLSIFVLMTQGRESAIAELREELTLQVNLRIEEEVTKTLQLVAGFYTRLGQRIGEDPELRAMLEPLDPGRIEQELMDQIEDAIPRMRASRKPSGRDH